jgi:hypothetical protein
MNLLQPNTGNLIEMPKNHRKALLSFILGVTCIFPMRASPEMPGDQPPSLQVPSGALRYIFKTYIEKPVLKSAKNPEFVPLMATEKKNKSSEETHGLSEKMAKKTADKTSKKDPVGAPIPQVSATLYQNVYGRPHQADVVLILWTGLTCPLCSILHQGAIVQLKKLALKNPKFSLILRDYPADPISLVGSAMVWSRGEPTARRLLNSLHTQHDWMHFPEKALDALEILALQTAHSEQDRAAIRWAKTDKALHQKLFETRNQDKNALAITQVPWAIVMTKNMAAEKAIAGSRIESGSTQSKESDWKLTVLDTQRGDIVEKIQELSQS